LTDFETKIGTTFLDYEHNPLYNSYHKYSHEKAVNRLLPDIGGGVIAELGCAGGTYYGLIKNKNYKIINGVDLSAERLQKAAQKGYVTFNTLAQNLPFENNSIDTVLSIDMLVHVLFRNDRAEIFKEVSRVLKREGVFVFSIPPKKAYVYGDYGVSRNIIYSDKDGIINDYCCLIDFDEITALSNSNGFVVEKIISTQFDLKIFKLLKRVTKERFHYNFTLPVLDKFFGKVFLKELGKAVFFKLRKI
jgi:SAM-dependent methyltransferase